MAGKTDAMAKFFVNLVLLKIEDLKKQEDELKRKSENPNKILALQKKIKILEDITEGRIDMNKAVALWQGIRDINKKIEVLNENRVAIIKEIEKYPSLGSIMAILKED
ncbi:MAG: hypothetical protein UT05_C0012G0014 [Parcubacteria group bacterium GW2011_GWF2_38_76]|nr:MAG: hypothetical protein UT05_C0012G0014 [Parcubacteria group bacterium GW2011_GWF2_38_76]HBM46064.1 hypothetical protein [Patescibacteria group bacterium]